MAVNGVSDIIKDMYNSNLRKSSSSALSVDDFLILLAAQMRNQDMMNPMNDTEFIGQLAQFTTLQAMQEMNQLNSTQYSVSLVGKEVTVAQIGITGELVIETGIVTGAGLFNGEPFIYIGDNAYPLSSIMVVGTMPVAPPEEGDGDGEEGGEGSEVPPAGETPEEP